MKKLIVLGAALMALAACADSPPVPPPAPSAAPEFLSGDAKDDLPF